MGILPAGCEIGGEGKFDVGDCVVVDEGCVEVGYVEESVGCGVGGEGDKNPIRTLGDYSRPSQEGYRNTIELLKGNNVVPLRSDTIRLVQNRCSFHVLWSEDLNQHLKDFLKLVDSLDLDDENKKRTRLAFISIFPMRSSYQLA
ncbi:hypothetical protein Tco_1022312 [Tanacetum coccineum]